MGSALYADQSSSSRATRKKQAEGPAIKSHTQTVPQSTIELDDQNVSPNNQSSQSANTRGAARAAQMQGEIGSPPAEIHEESEAQNNEIQEIQEEEPPAETPVPTIEEQKAKAQKKQTTDQKNN